MIFETWEEAGADCGEARVAEERIVGRSNSPERVRWTSCSAVQVHWGPCVMMVIIMMMVMTMMMMMMTCVQGFCSLKQEHLQLRTC